MEARTGGRCGLRSSTSARALTFASMSPGCYSVARSVQPPASSALRCERCGPARVSRRQAPSHSACANQDRPWKFGLDLFGVCSTAHALLFGKYLEVTRVDGLWTPKERLKRYWAVPLWESFFQTLLNQPASSVASRPPLQGLISAFHAQLAKPAWRNDTRAQAAREEMRMREVMRDRGSVARV